MMSQYVGAIQAQSRALRNRVRTSGAGSNSCVIKTSTFYQFNAGSTGTTALGTPLDPFGAFGTTAVGNIAGSYEFYRIRSLAIEFVPTTGTTTSGYIQMAYLENPEIIYNFVGATATNRYTIIDNAQNVQTISASFPRTFTFASDRRRGRDWYSCNVSGETASPEVIDRSLASYFAVTLAGFAANQSVMFMGHITWELSGLGITAGYTLKHAPRLGAVRDSDDDPDDDPVLVYMGNDWSSFPKAVVVRNRNLGDQVYAIQTGVAAAEGQDKDVLPRDKPPPPQVPVSEGNRA